MRSFFGQIPLEKYQSISTLSSYDLTVGQTDNQFKRMETAGLWSSNSTPLKTYCLRKSIIHAMLFVYELAVAFEVSSKKL